MFGGKGGCPEIKRNSHGYYKNLILGQLYFSLNQ